VCGVDLRKEPPVVVGIAGGTNCVTAVRSGPFRGLLYADGYHPTFTSGPAAYFELVDRAGRTVRSLERSAYSDDPAEDAPQTGAFCGQPRRLDFQRALRRGPP
jgi:hypothetical protein